MRDLTAESTRSLLDHHTHHRLTWEALPRFLLSWDGREPGLRTRQAWRPWGLQKLLSRHKRPRGWQGQLNLCSEGWGVSSPSADSSSPPWGHLGLFSVRTSTTSSFSPPHLSDDGLAADGNSTTVSNEVSLTARRSGP